MNVFLTAIICFITGWFASYIFEAVANPLPNEDEEAENKGFEFENDEEI